MTPTQLQRLHKIIYVGACEPCRRGLDELSGFEKRRTAVFRITECDACLDIFVTAMIAAADEPCAHCECPDAHEERNK